jgi:hypothetical protein
MLLCRSSPLIYVYLLASKVEEKKLMIENYSKELVHGVSQSQGSGLQLLFGSQGLPVGRAKPVSRSELAVSQWSHWWWAGGPSGSLRFGSF